MAKTEQLQPNPNHANAISKAKWALASHIGVTNILDFEATKEQREVTGLRDAISRLTIEASRELATGPFNETEEEFAEDIENAYMHLLPMFKLMSKDLIGRIEGDIFKFNLLLDQVAKLIVKIAVKRTAPQPEEPTGDAE